MTCPGAEDLLLYAAGRPPIGDERGLERHMAACALCRADAKAYAAMSDRLRAALAEGAAPKGTHPSDEELSLYAAGEHAEPMTIELHLASCPACLDLATIARRAAAGPVPASVIRRAEAAGRAAVAAAAPESVEASPRPTRRRLSVVRTKSTAAWVPFVIAAAAAVLLVIALHSAVEPKPASRPESPIAAHPTTPTKPATPAPVEHPSSPAVAGTPKTPSTPVVPVTPPESVKKEEAVAVVPSPTVPPTPTETPRVETPVSPPTPELTRAESAPSVDVTEVAGRVQVFVRSAGEPHLLQTGEKLKPGDRLETEFGRHGYLRLAGHEVVLNHRTSAEIASAGDEVVLALTQGELFAVTGKSDVHLAVRTPAGLARPEGTQYLVQVRDHQTTLAVKEGRVQFSRNRSEIAVPAGSLVTCAEKGSLSRPRGITDATLFETDLAILEYGRGPNRDYLLLYPAAPRRSSVVVAAPHEGAEGGTAEMAADLASLMGAPCVVAAGYKNRNIDVSLPGPAGAKEAREAHDRYLELLRRAAPVATDPLPLLAEIHAWVAPLDDPVMEIASAGFSKEELEKLKARFAVIQARHGGGRTFRIAFDQTDPTYVSNGATRQFHSGAGALRKSGVFRPEIARRALKIELVSPGRLNEQEKTALATVLGEWLGEIR